MEKESNKRRVAIVDSNDASREQLNKALISYYDIVDYHEGRFSLKALMLCPPALILMAEDVSPSNSINFYHEIRATAELRFTPVIHIIDGKNRGLIEKSKEAGIENQLLMPFKRSHIVSTMSEILNKSVEKDWEALPDLQRTALQNSVGVFNNIADVLMTGESVEFNEVKDSCQSLVSSIEKNDFLSILNGVRDHDDYTYAHSMRVATMLTLLGHAAGFKNDDQLLMSSGGLLHDVGKMKIPHHILNKPGRLTDDEFEVMKSHVNETVDYLDKLDDIPHGVRIIAEQHHEKIGGGGYPHGLKGKELNELARMAAIVDVFSALTDRRVYKEPMESSKAMTIMTEEMSDHLDQHYVKLFKSILVDSKVLV